MKKGFTTWMATLGAAAVLMLPATAMARDRDDWNRDRYNNGYYNGMSAHQRHELEEQQRRYQREQQRGWERAQRSRAYNNGYYNNGYGYPSNNGYYNNGRVNGYYDRYGNFHQQGSYDRWGNYHPY